MSKKRTAAILNLLDSYRNLCHFKFPEPLLTDSAPLYQYKLYINKTFIENHDKKPGISINAIEAITKNINEFIESSGSSNLEPIQDILPRYPLGWIESTMENAASIFDYLFPHTAITPLEIYDIGNVQSPRNGDEVPTRLHNLPCHNLPTAQEPSYSQSSAHIIHHPTTYDNDEHPFPHAALGASSYSDFPL